jgi:threonine synthase
MLYTSTRGGGEPEPFSAIVLKGLAPNGGLYVPGRVPHPTLQTTQLVDMPYLSYAEIATSIMQMFGPDIERSWWEQTLGNIYTPKVFGNHAVPVEGEEMLPIRSIDDGKIHIADLSTGPTLAFKDWALQLLGRLFAREAKNRRLTIIGATSGDTGSAAIEALRGLDIPVFMLSPERGMSEFQKAQMYSVRDPHIHNIAIKGSFDDCQRIVKQLNANESFVREYGVGAVNSINWARIAAQVVYYAYIYSRMRKVHHGARIDVVVPSGNFGNAYAAIVARKIGIPLDKIIVATNANDVLYDFWTTGRYAPRERTISTMSPSMDITAASNIERLVYDVMSSDTATVRALYDDLAKRGAIDLSEKRTEICEYIGAARTIESQCLATIRTIYEREDMIIDPHTAVAVSAAERYRRRSVPIVALATAQPCKFDDAMQVAIGTVAPRPRAFRSIELRDQYVTYLDNNPSQVHEFVASTLGG